MPVPAPHYDGTVDIERRRSLAAATAALLPEVEAAVVDSWSDLLPTSAQWPNEAVRQARRAIRAALDALAIVIAQGDLDDDTWQTVRAEVTDHGHMHEDVVLELLRTVRVAGVEHLADRLAQTVGLPSDERWSVQTQADWLFEQLAGTSEEIDPHQLAALLGELHRDGPDSA